MKTPSIALLNSIGFTNYAQKAFYAATVLKAATVQSPQVPISNAVTAVPGKRPVVGYAGFTGFSGQTAAQNTTGKLAGEVFPGRPVVTAIGASNGYGAVALIPALAPSPAYPAGTAIPSYPAIPARAAIVEVLPVVGKTAVVAPATTPLLGYADAVKIEDLGNGVIEITAYLPKATSPALIGSGISKTVEITPANATPLIWIGRKASETPTALSAVPATLEEYFLENATNALLNSSGAGSITTENRPIGGTVKTCTKVMLKVQFSSSWNTDNPDPQLDTIGYYTANSGEGNGTAPGM
jgi:hypothetical protein